MRAWGGGLGGPGRSRGEPWSLGGAVGEPRCIAHLIMCVWGEVLRF